MRIYKGDIFYAGLTPVVGCEQGGIRPVLIIQNNIGNRYSPTVIVVAITSCTEKNPLPTHIRLYNQQLHKDLVIPISFLHDSLVAEMLLEAALKYASPLLNVLVNSLFICGIDLFALTTISL